MNQRAPTVVALGELLWDRFPDQARFGGAPGNFAHHAAALGATAYVVSAVGDDDLGRQAIERLRGSGIDVTHVATHVSWPTGSVDVGLDDQGQPTYRFHQPEAWDFLEFNESLAALAARCDAVCFGTLAQRGEQSRDTIAAFLAATRDSALRVFDINLREPFIDDGVIDRSLRLANVLKLNNDELAYLAGRYHLRSPTEAGQAAELVEKYQLRMLALTRGRRGALVIGANEQAEVRGEPVDVVDTVGAGDAFTAAIVIGLLRGRPIELIAESACRIAEFVCTQAGAVPAMPSSVFRAD